MMMFMFPIGQRTPLDARRHQRASLPTEASARRWAAPMDSLQAPLARGFFFAWRAVARSAKAADER
jgi:hypothetical protein